MIKPQVWQGNTLHGVRVGSIPCPTINWSSNNLKTSHWVSTEKMLLHNIIARIKLWALQCVGAADFEPWATYNNLRGSNPMHHCSKAEIKPNKWDQTQTLEKMKVLSAHTCSYGLEKRGDIYLTHFKWQKWKRIKWMYMWKNSEGIFNPSQTTSSLDSIFTNKIKKTERHLDHMQHH